jgi:sugar phosphate isomerase/epimerase
MAARTGRIGARKVTAMHLDHLPGDVHLTYCTNIHAGETWNEVRSSLAAHVPQIKEQVSPQKPMGLGLRLSGIAADELSAPAVPAEFRRFLSDHELYVFTINAFPYGPFHGRPVKEEVYQPDWRMPERLHYSDRVAEILAALLPAGVVGSISTVPGTFKPLAKGNGVPRVMADNITRHVAKLVEIERRTGREIVLALEAEPCCYLEIVDETIAFFRDYLHRPENAAALAALTGQRLEDAAAALQRHVGVCYDVCHGALQYEEPSAAFARFSAAGIRVAKLQLSSALRVSGVGETTQKELSAFDDGVYLHQVVQQRNGTLTRFVDLDPAFAALRAGQAGGEWRVHCHVPIFLPTAGAFESTQQTLRSALACIPIGFVAPHLEVETYTWDVLPAALREGNRADAIAREMKWVMQELQA